VVLQWRSVLGRGQGCDVAPVACAAEGGLASDTRMEGRGNWGGCIGWAPVAGAAGGGDLFSRQGHSQQMCWGSSFARCCDVGGGCLGGGVGQH